MRCGTSSSMQHPTMGLKRSNSPSPDLTLPMREKEILSLFFGQSLAKDRGSESTSWAALSPFLLVRETMIESSQLPSRVHACIGFSCSSPCMHAGHLHAGELDRFTTREPLASQFPPQGTIRSERRRRSVCTPLFLFSTAPFISFQSRKISFS